MAVGVCSSSIMRSSLRSISSRRRRISERVSSEVMAEPQGRGPILRLGGCGWGLKLAERIKTRPSSLCSGGRSVLCSLLLPTSPSGRYPLVALTLSGDLFVHAKHLFIAAKPPCSGSLGGLVTLRGPTAKPITGEAVISADRARQFHTL